MLLFLIVLVISIAVAGMWMRILKRFDFSAAVKNSGNPIRGFFFAGLLSVPTVFVLYVFVGPFILTLTSGSPLLYQIIHVGLIEEVSKFIIFYVAAVQTNSIKEPRDGILHAASVALAFAIIENILYSFYGIEVLLVRSVLTVVGHMTYAAIWGYATGVILYTRKADSKEYGNSIIASALIIAAIFHGMYNFLLDIGHSGSALLTVLLNLLIALWSLSYLKKRSPYEKFPIEKYRSAIPQLEMALASNPRNFALNKRIGLHYIRAGSTEKARRHLRRASKTNRGELSSRFYLHLLDALTKEEEKDAEAKEKFLKVAWKIPLGKLEKMMRETRKVFTAHPRKEEMKELLRYVRENRCEGRPPASGVRWDYSPPGDKGKILGPPAETAQLEAATRQEGLGAALQTRQALSTLDPAAFERKAKAAGRIIEEKQRELYRE